MATGEHSEGHAVATIDPADLPEGTVVTGSGRVSGAVVFAEPDTTGKVPFSTQQLARGIRPLNLPVEASWWSRPTS